MLTDKQKEELKQLYEAGKPKKTQKPLTEEQRKLMESYLDAKIEFSEPFIIENLKGSRVLGINVGGGKTYYMTTEVARSYISSMERILGKIGSGEADTGEPVQSQSGNNDAFVSESTDSKKKLDEAITRVNAVIGVNERDKSIKIKFVNLDNNVSALLKTKLPKNYDGNADILTIH